MVLRQCAVCGRRFTKTEHYKRHERSHTRERPYRCSVCGKSFSRSDVLCRHMKCHTQRNETAGDTQPKIRRSTISEGITPQINQDPVNDQPTERSNSHTGIPLMRILSPNNFVGTDDSNVNSRVGNALLEAPNGNFIDSNSNQSHNISIPIPNDWNVASPANNFVTPTHPASIQRNSPSQQSSEPSNFETSTSSSNQPGHTPRSDNVVSQFTNGGLDWVSQGTNLGQGEFHDPFQMWLFPSLGDLDNSPDFLHTYSGAQEMLTPGNPKQPFEGKPFELPDQAKEINTVPRERFSRVQRCWGPRPGRLHRLIPVLWKDVISTTLDNLFSEDNASQNDLTGAPNWGLDTECRFRLKDAFRTPAPSVYHSPRLAPNVDPLIASTMQESAEFPPAEILDIALGLFFRRFHPTVPFIHIPTFSVKTTPLPLLFAICLIGLSILGTTGATRFVSRMFPSFLQRVCADLATCAAETSNPIQQLTIFATALLTLNLAVMTGDKDRLAQCQMLYVNLISMAQQHGLFAAEDGQDLDSLMSEMTESEYQWKAWCRVESTKRLILGLLLADSWYSNLQSRSPVIRSEAVCVIGPCDESLFQAKSATQWQSLLRSGKQPTASKIRLSDLHLPRSESTRPLGFLGASSLLALLQVQILESYHRLMPPDQLQIGYHIPWRLYMSDARSQFLVPAVLAASRLDEIASYKSETNCKVLWHSLCIMLLADFRMFELAAGRHGPAPASGALDEIAQWAQSVSARRACVHAAQNFKLMSERRVSDNVTVHSVSALFASALVLGLYLFMVPPTAAMTGGNAPIELVEVDVDWKELERIGFTEDRSHKTGINGTNDNMMNGHSEPSFPSHRDHDVSPIYHFIRFGGPVSLNGVQRQGGYESARRVLLDFANLMDGISGRKLRAFTQILHIMSDDLMNVDPTV